MFAQSLPLILTLLAIGAGILFNNKGLSDLKADVKELRGELKADIAAARAESRADLGKLEARLDTRLNAIQSEQLHFSELKGHLEGRIDEIAKLVTERVAA